MRNVISKEKIIFFVIFIVFSVFSECEAGAIDNNLENTQRIEKSYKASDIESINSDIKIIKESISIILFFTNFFSQHGLPSWAGQALGILLIIILPIFGYLKNMIGKINALKNETNTKYDAFEEKFMALSGRYADITKNNERLTKLLEKGQLEKNNADISELLKNIGDGKTLQQELSQVKTSLEPLKVAQPASLEEVLALKIDDLRKVAGIYLLPCYARLAMEEGSWEDARFFWDKYLAVVPDDLTSLYYMGWCLLQQGKTAEDISSEDQYHMFIEACRYFESLAAMPDLQGHKDYRWSLAEAKLYASFYTDDISKAKRLRGLALNILAEVAESEHPCCPEEAIATFLFGLEDRLLQRHQRLIVAGLAIMVCQRASAECNTENSFLNVYGLVLLFYYRATTNLKLQKKILLTAEEKFEKSIKMEASNALGWNGWGYILVNLADIVTDTVEKRRLLLDSTNKCERATALKPEQDTSWSNWGYALQSLAGLEIDTVEKSRLLIDATGKCKRATEINLQNDASWGNWGSTLQDLASLKKNTVEKRRLLLDSTDKCKRSTEINPLNDGSWGIWGSALRYLAEIETDAAEKRRLLLDSTGKYERAIDINPQADATWVNWGSALRDLAYIESDPVEKRNLLLDSTGKYKRATEINPKNASAWHNWSYLLQKTAEIEQDRDNERILLLDSARKCERAIEINPENNSIWHNWGYTFQKIAEIEQYTDKKRILLQDSIEKFERSVALGNSSDWVRENLKQLREELAQLK